MIETFRGNNFFLSNMKPLENWITTDHGIDVPTSEHAYQAAKFNNNLVLHENICAARAADGDNRIFADGLAAKELAHKYQEFGVIIVDDWEVAKRGIMLSITRKKYEKNPDLAEMLLGTGDQEIVEGNDWGDRDWGVDPIGSDNGENNLGKIIMQVRDELRSL